MADRIKGITVVLGGNTTGLNKALESTNKEIKSTQTQLKDVEKLLKLDPTNTKLLEQRQRLLAESIKETKNKLDTLKQAEKQVQQQFKQGKISQQQYEGLQREIFATEQQLEYLEEKAKTSNATLQKIGETAKKVAEGTDKISDSLDKVKSATMVASGAVVAGATLGVKTISDMDSAMADFTSKTGLAAESAEYWKESLEEIYNNGYGENFEDIADAMALVRNEIGAIDTDNLTKLSEDAFALRDVFGYDIAESVRAAKALIDNFGIDGRQAFELIAEGAQNGLDYSGELLDSISEYSVQFGKLGISAEEMFTIFSAGAENGAFNLDKIGDAVKEFSIRAIDGSKSTKEGFQAIGLSANEMAKQIAAGGESAKKAFEKTLSSLMEIEDPVERNAAGVSLFGTMWEDLGEKAVFAMQETTETLYGAEEALEKIKETKYDNLLDNLKALGRTATTEIIAPLAEQLMPTIEKLLEKVAALIQTFGGLSSSHQNLVLGVAGFIAVLPILINLLSGVLSAIGAVSTGIALFTGAATTGSSAATGISIALKAVSSSIGFVRTAVTSLSTLVTGTIIPAITSSLSSFFAFLAANPIILIITAIALAIIGLVTLIATKGDEIKALLQKVDDFLQNIFVQDWTQVFGPILGGILNGFFANLKNIWDSTKQLLDGVIDFIQGVFTGNWERAWEGVKNIFGGVFSGLVSLAKAPLNAVIGLLNGAIGGINMLIGGLNKINFSLPSWIPKVGGKSFGINIPMISNIPYLAKGGVLSQGSAVVGEAGPELLTMMGNKAMVQPLTNQSNTTNLGGVNVTVYGAVGQDVHELASIIMDEIQSNTDRKGAVFGA